jgi:hypothetical protein
LSVRGLRAEVDVPGRMRFQMLLMQSGRDVSEFTGRYEITLSGVTTGNRAWSGPPMEGGRGDVKLKQYARVEGTLSFPAEVTVRSVTVRVLDSRFAVRANHTQRL